MVTQLGRGKESDNVFSRFDKYVYKIEADIQTEAKL